MEVDNDMEKIEEQNLTARPYQNQILEIALRQNTIIYLPTGAGKTFIAIMAMKEMSKPLEKPFSEGGKRSVFLCNTVALARQQYDCIRSLVNLKVSLYTGDMNVDNWKREKWREEFQEYQVFVATAQIILDVIRHGFISVTDFNLMIFDECHHAVNSHPMNQILSLFQNEPANQLPRVIGLTGLLLKSTSPDNIEDDLKKMEAIFRGIIVTVSTYEEYQNVLVHSTKPYESTIKYTKYPPKESICKKVEALTQICKLKIGRWHIDTKVLLVTKGLEAKRAANPVKKAENHWEDFLQKFSDMGIYGASIAILSFMVEFELKKRSAETQSIRNMSRLCISYAERIRHELVEYMKDNSDYEAGDEYELHEIIYDNSTQKIQAFLGYIETTFTGKKPKDISCLVFVERRQTAKCLYYLVKHYVENKPSIPIVPEFMVGQSKTTPDSIETWLEAKKQKHVLRKFKRGDCNMVIASSVLEEGIDVQSCNYVIIYDDLKHFGSYVQTKGRARMQNSCYTIMLENGNVPKFITKIQKWKRIEESLRKFLVGKTIDRMLPLQEEIDEQFVSHIEPFFTRIGARLEENSVVSLLNRYCMTLPQDCFTSSVVQWSKETTEDRKVIVKLVMPPQSTIKEDIIGDKMGNAKDAKRSAAMKACIQLYQNRELNDHLLPVSKTNCFEFVEDVYFKHWEPFKTDNPRLAGTTKCKRQHSLQFPHQLCEATPLIGSSSYMYSIRMKPTFPVDSESEWVFKLLTSVSSYAILTRKELPCLAKMPLFLSQGEVICEIDPKPQCVTLKNEEELVVIKRFHVTLFRDILEVWNTFFALDHANKENSFCVVPTKNDSIDWDLIHKCQALQKPRALTEIQRKRLNFNPSDYENTVVSPWYSNDENARYVVLKVLTDLTPFSPFPSGNYENYAAYVRDKYNQEVMVHDQFMLLVQPLRSRINCIHPGTGESGRRKKTKRFDDIKLIPELCHNMRFPGDLWLKAIFLPTILHRVHYLLIAENLRTTINNYLGLSNENHIPRILPVEIRRQEIDEMNGSANDDEEMASDGPKKNAQHINNADIGGISGQNEWSEHEEPADLDRKLDELYEIELDYYMQFVESKMLEISLEDQGKSSPAGNSPLKLANMGAICNDPAVKTYDIELLRNRGEINQVDMLMAITRSSANDVFDMERLELLGDSFLKFSVSLYIFDKHQSWNEGCLTALKGRLVSNRNLFYHSNHLNLPGMLNIEAFYNDWQPPMTSVPKKIRQAIVANGVSPYVLFKLTLDDEEIDSGDVKNATLEDFMGMFPQEQPCEDSSLLKLLGARVISDKCCSDSMEAILGACVKNLGIECSFQVLNLFQVFAKEEGNDISRLMKKINYSARVSGKVKISDIDYYLSNYEDIERTLGYKFKERAYLLQALTHPSYVSNRLTGCYQTLEFLGDAVLDFVVSSYIFERCAHMGPGELTDLRSALVNNTFLACLTVKHKFHLHLLNQSAVLMKSIASFVHFQETKGNKINDQVRILVAEEDCAIADYIEVPKALGDIFEAIVGAVFLDSGNDLEVTWKTIYNLMSNEIGQYVQNVPKQLVRQLKEITSANAQFMPPVVDENIVMVACQFSCRGKLCEVNGFGQNKESAKVSAAKLALQALGKVK